MIEQRIASWSSLGAVVKGARIEQGLTQQGLAHKAGVSRAWLARVESGHRGAELEQVLKTLSALGVTLTARTTALDARDDALSAALARSRNDRPRLGLR